MGFYSWKTADTKESIPCIHSDRETFPVTLLSPDGRKWLEEYYEGYGEFDGKDVYELIAELHGKKTRIDGINLAYSDTPLKYPIKIVRDGTLNYDDVGVSDTCEYQGFFYDDIV
jgi:hypothetical protein